MTSHMTADALARLTARLADADLVGFGRDADRLATAKVGQGKGPSEFPPEVPPPEA